MGKIIRDGNVISTHITSPAPIEPETISFYGYTGTTLDLSWIDSTRKMTSMGGMFGNCTGLTSLDLSNFNTSNVTDMGDMFYYCSSLTSLDLGKFDTSKVITMTDMFSNCSSLTHLDLSSFNTSNVTDMSGMFQDCKALTYLDISSFDFTNVTSYTNMFNNVPDSCEILVKDEAAKTWITSNFTNLTNVVVK